MNKWVLLAGAVVTEVSATLSLKGALVHPWLYLVVVVGYVAAFTCLDRMLRAGMPLGVAYGLWGALGVASTAVLSSVLFGETLSPVAVVGIGCIMAGVLAVELGHRSHDEEHAQ